MIKYFILGRYSMEEGFELAISCGKSEVVDLLIQKGINVNTFRSNSDTALIIAAACGFVDCVHVLLRYGVNINEMDDLGSVTPLICATYHDRDEVLVTLFKANYMIEKNNGNLKMGTVESVVKEHHSECGLSIDKQNKYGESALIVAAMHNHVKCLQLLLEQNACVDLQDKEGMTALMHAATYGNFECMEILVDSNAKLDITDNSGNDALMKCIFERNDDDGRCASFLIEAGCLIDHKNNDDKTALTIAIEYDEFAIIKKLIARGVDVNHCVKNVSALWGAVHKRVSIALQILLDAGANPNVGRPPIVACVSNRYCSVECVMRLLEAGADINSIDGCYGTMMLNAAKEGKANIVRIALDEGGELNISHVKFEKPHIYNEEALMLLFAAGEDCDYFKCSTEAPKAIIDTRKDISLLNVCRKSIREHLLVTRSKQNLFKLVELLPLPKAMKKYLVYDVLL